MREQLDSVPRTRSNIKYIIKACDELVDSLQGLKQAEQDVFTSMDIWLLRSQAEMVVLRVSDSPDISIMRGWSTFEQGRAS